MVLKSKELDLCISEYSPEFNKQLIQVWENSVLATHSFLDPEDFKEIKTLVEGIDFGSFPVYCLLKENEVVGFFGLENRKVEMLFIDPKYFGQGIGKRLIKFAIENFQINKVDVNEQNVNAVEFYKHLGFVVYERTEKDDQGKNYPLLRMKLS